MTKSFQILIGFLLGRRGHTQNHSCDIDCRRAYEIQQSWICYDIQTILIQDISKFPDDGVG